MYTPASDEKTTLVLAYTHNMLIRGEAVTKDNVRVSVWLRTDGAPNYIHLLNAQVLVFGGAAPKTLTYPEFFLPVQEVVAFHVAPPNNEPLDYSADEKNRSMEDVNLLLGTFIIKGKARYSSQTGLGNSLEVARTVWMSLYDVVVVNPYLFDVRADADGVHPVKEREIVRAAGPSVRRDLGKQAHHVSI